MGVARPADDSLRRAEEQEFHLRRRLNDLLVEQRRAEVEAARLDQRAQLEAADSRVSQAAANERRRAADLASAVEATQSALRAQEGLVAQLRTERGPA